MLPCAYTIVTGPALSVFALPPRPRDFKQIHQHPPQYIPTTTGQEFSEVSKLPWHNQAGGECEALSSLKNSDRVLSGRWPNFPPPMASRAKASERMLELTLASEPSKIAATVV